MVRCSPSRGVGLPPHAQSHSPDRGPVVGGWLATGHRRGVPPLQADGAIAIESGRGPRSLARPEDAERAKHPIRAPGVRMRRGKGSSSRGCRTGAPDWRSAWGPTGRGSAAMKWRLIGCSARPGPSWSVCGRSAVSPSSSVANADSPPSMPRGLTRLPCHSPSRFLRLRRRLRLRCVLSPPSRPRHGWTIHPQCSTSGSAARPGPGSAPALFSRTRRTRRRSCPRKQDEPPGAEGDRPPSTFPRHQKGGSPVRYPKNGWPRPSRPLQKVAGPVPSLS